MSQSATLKFTATGALVAIGEKTYTGDEQVAQSFSVADSATDEQRTLNIDVSEMQMIYIVSDQDILMEWNDDAGAQGSIALQANVPFIEKLAADQYHTAEMDVDVTDLYFTNASGSAANIKIIVIQNNTP
jgi:hypothetical protein